MGLQQHIGRQTTKNDVCGIYYKIKERLKRKRLFQKRREAVREEKITNLGPLEHLIFKKKLFRNMLAFKDNTYGIGSITVSSTPSEIMT